MTAATVVAGVVIVLWARRWWSRTAVDAPWQMFPGSRSAAMRELLRRADEECNNGV